jgi:acetoacetate decarboxylase
MVEYNNQIDYSMPRQCGLYPPPPYIYKEARAIVLVFQCAPNIKKKYLPPELRSIEQGLDTLIILEYPNTSIGPYNECIIALNCTYNNISGRFIFSIYVDDDVALTAGREIWGIPKKLANIDLSQIKDKRIIGTVTRKGIKIIDINVEIMDTEPGLDTKAMFETLPFYNLKLIPDIVDNSKPALRQLTETYIKIEKVHKQNSIFANALKSKISQYDISYEILHGANIDLGGFYVECDMILPNGRILV